MFLIEVFLHWDLFQKESPGCSERSYLTSLEQFSVRKGRVGTINSNSFSCAFKEWKYCQYKVNILRHMDWMKCPACEDSQHSVHVDGNMKLYRFKSAGSRQRDCFYGDVFVASTQRLTSTFKKCIKAPNTVPTNKIRTIVVKLTGEQLVIHYARKKIFQRLDWK